MNIALLCPIGIQNQITGVRTFVLESAKALGSIPIIMSRTEEVPPSGFQFASMVRDPEIYDATILTTCLYETEDEEILGRYPSPRILYLHTYDSLKHGNLRFLKYIDYIAYDRPLLAKAFISQNPSLDIPYREITLPYSLKESHRNSGGEGFFTIGRFVKEKKILEILDIARLLPTRRFYIAGPIPKKTDKNYGYFEQVREKAKSLLNVVFRDLEDGVNSQNLVSLGEEFLFYIGMTEDPNGTDSYGIEYAAMEAMNAGCVPIIHKSMEFEYRRQGAMACFAGDSNLPLYFDSLYLSYPYLYRHISHNLRFLADKNLRFLSQISSIIYECDHRFIEKRPIDMNKINEIFSNK